MFNRLAGLRERAEVLDMLQHVVDAQHDIFVWPHLRNKILEDLEAAIESAEVYGVDLNVETEDLTPTENLL